jgi:hypothetical protein
MIKNNCNLIGSWVSSQGKGAGGVSRFVSMLITEYPAARMTPSVVMRESFDRELKLKFEFVVV